MNDQVQKCWSSIHLMFLWCKYEYIIFTRSIMSSDQEMRNHWDPWFYRKKLYSRADCNLLCLLILTVTRKPCGHAGWMKLMKPCSHLKSGGRPVAGWFFSRHISVLGSARVDGWRQARQGQTTNHLPVLIMWTPRQQNLLSLAPRSLSLPVSRNCGSKHKRWANVVGNRWFRNS